MTPNISMPVIFILSLIDCEVYHVANVNEPALNIFKSVIGHFSS